MAFDLVFFGGTGDLTWRKLMPSLFQAWRHGTLPPGGRILAVARDDQDDTAGERGHSARPVFSSAARLWPAACSRPSCL